MKKLNLLILAVLTAISFGTAKAQDNKSTITSVVNSMTKSSDELKKVETDSLSNWKISGAAGFNSSITMLTNWAAGGNNTASLIGYGNIRIIYQKNKFAWETLFDTDFGYTYLENSKYAWRKSNDKINLSSKAGYDVGNNLYATLLGSFRTQYLEGYAYPNDTTKNYISDLFAPAYIDLSLGLDWKPNDIFSAYFSPAAGRITICKDDMLKTIYGVELDKTTRAEFGALIKGAANYQLNAFKISSALTMFTPYSKNFGNIDVDWDMSISYQLMKVLNVSLGTSLKYYDAIKFDTQDGKGKVQHIQFKTLLGVGVAYNF